MRMVPNKSFQRTAHKRVAAVLVTPFDAGEVLPRPCWFRGGANDR